MALKNYQFNTIARTYDNLRLQNKHDLNRRIKEVYARIPELAEIDTKIAEGSVNSAKSALLGNTKALSSLKKVNQTLSEQKQELLKLHGYPFDYLNPHYQCSDCEDTGFINNQKCHCFKQAVVDLVYAQSNVKQAISAENFSTFSFRYYADEYIEESTGLTPLANMHRVVDCAKDFVSMFDISYQNLLIYGNTGVGKTFLTNCIAGDLLDSGYTVIYLTAFQFFQVMENYKFNRTNDNYESLQNQFDYILDCDLLIIDDLGTEMNNTFTSSQLYLCVNERHLKQKSTVISTNLSLEKLNTNYSERTYSRLFSNYTLLKIVGEDIRIQKLLL